MKSSDRAILCGIALVGLVAAFWFIVLSPKREEASSLGDQVSEAQASVSQAEQDAAASEDAQKDFRSNYRRVVALGKAVPADADTPSLLTQLQALSERSGVDFRSIALNSAASGAAAATPAAPTTPPAATTDTSSTDTSTAAVTTPTPTATEAAAALLPIGATLGPAGLPVMPYSLQFDGGFFQTADFFGRLDGMVVSSHHGDAVQVSGRLLTIDAFELSAGAKGFPDLNVSVAATSYVTPADQGIAAGSTSAGPAPTTSTPAAITPAQPSSTDVPTATVSP